MVKLSYIDKSIVENPDFNNSTQDITISVTLTDGEVVSFVAQKEFFTPRQIATNLGDVALMENVVDHTATNVPVVKMSNIGQNISTPQYYLNSIVSDQYPIIPIDTYFLELDNDLKAPTPPEDLLQQRQLALNTLLNLQDATTAVMAADPLAYSDAMANVAENYDAGLDNVEPIPADQQLTPEEADQLAALDLAGITTVDSPDIAADNISPTPEVSTLDLLSKRDAFAKVMDRSADAKKINAGIELINAGVKSAEANSQTGLTADGKCKYITVAKGKKGGFLGIGAKNYEKKVSREDTEKRLSLVKEDIVAQEASPTVILQTKSGVSMFVKVQKAGLFGSIVNILAKVGTFALAVTCMGPAGLVLAGGAGILSPTVIPKGHKPMSKQQALSVLQKTQQELEGILAKDCE